MKNLRLILLPLLMFSLVTQAEWTNRYPKVDGQRHHIYLESYELPILSSGPKYPAASPDGQSLAFASNGWIWILDLKTNVAKRVTAGISIDGRPRWSPDSSRLAFVADTGTDSAITVLNIKTGDSLEIDTEKIDLDPEFSADGKSLYLSSGKEGVLDIWQYSFSSGIFNKITELDGHSRNPRLSSDGASLYFSHLDWPERQIRVRSLADGKEKVLKTVSIAGQFGFDIHPLRDVLAYAWPVHDDLNLVVADVNDLAPVNNLTPGKTYVQGPAWSSDGQTIYYSEPDKHQQFKLMSVPVYGGSAKEVPIKKWDWGQERTVVKVVTKLNGKVTPTRLSVKGPTGHAIPNTLGATYFDSQNGEHYFYSDGSVEIEVPVGEITVKAVHGLMGMAVSVTSVAAASQSNKIVIPVTEVWEARAAGYKSADFHLHLNYDGPYRQVTSDIEPLLAGENLDLATPQAANLHNRLMDKEFLGDTVATKNGGLIRFAQEVRSHFHGHIGVVGPTEFYFPWFWGPGYPKHNDGNLSNVDVMKFVSSHPDSIGTYVHPIATDINPFEGANGTSIPLEFIPDGILSENVGLELVCAWSDALGTSELWYRLLNVGRPVIAMAGTDMFVDFHRTPAIGTARVYVQQSKRRTQWSPYISAVKQGRSFVTNSPVLLLTLDNQARPGDVVEGGKKSFRLEVASSIAFDRVEILVNGAVVWSDKGLNRGESRQFSGHLILPAGGWVAARAYGGETSWPLMDSYPFGHTSPVWINEIGSTDPIAKAQAQVELLGALNQLEAHAQQTYGDEDISKLMGRLKSAKAVLAN
ncbi:MAG: CehA/McbA family metallohydrolase [Porticoccaceae bacterium]|nr:CehA/McbA family metallohydrolase [Porticoccaceae bacterium]